MALEGTLEPHHQPLISKNPTATSSLSHYSLPLPFLHSLNSLSHSLSTQKLSSTSFTPCWFEEPSSSFSSSSSFDPFDLKREVSAEPVVALLSECT